MTLDLGLGLFAHSLRVISVRLAATGRRRRLNCAYFCIPETWMECRHARNTHTHTHTHYTCETHTKHVKLPSRLLYVCVLYAVIFALRYKRLCGALLKSFVERGKCIILYALYSFTDEPTNRFPDPHTRENSPALRKLFVSRMQAAFNSFNITLTCAHILLCALFSVCCRAVYRRCSGADDVERHEHK